MTTFAQICDAGECGAPATRALEIRRVAGGPVLERRALCDDPLCARVAFLSAAGFERSIVKVCTCGPNSASCPAHDAHDRASVARALRRTLRG